MSRAHQPGIYVEILIRADLDELWRLTQTPHLHERWDLRFSTIEYLPRPDPALPQRFLYLTRIGFGLTIAGEGETVGTREDAQGGRTSALKFWSDDPRSLIQEGSGYWQYTPTPDGIRFCTYYDYRARFGEFGKWLDRLLFRPLLGWATAWSFDRLRLWLEKGSDPTAALDRSINHALARLTLAFIWIYHGLVPKLWFRDPDELAMLRQSRLFSGHEMQALNGIGLAEILLGLAMVGFWQRRWPPRLSALLLLLLTAGAWISDPRVFTAPFNPLTLNAAMLALAFLGLHAQRDLPTSRNTRRTA